MKKIKYIIAILIMAASLIIIIQNKSDALLEGYGFGGNYPGMNISTTIGWVSYYRDLPSLYCVMHGDGFGVEGDVFTVANCVHIDGTRATGYASYTDSTHFTEATFISKDNAAMAYIAAQDDIMGVAKVNSPKQYAIWALMPLWKQELIGNGFMGLGDYTTHNGEATLDKSPLYKEAVENTSGVGGSVDLTNQRRNQQTATRIGDSVRIGPFNYTYNGEFKGIEIAGDNGQYTGEISYTPISSGNDFYINISISALRRYNIKAVRYIKMKIKAPNNYLADVIFLYNNHSGQQNQVFIYGTPDEGSTGDYIDMVTITITGQLGIKKVNSESETALDGVSFKLIMHYQDENNVWHDEYIGTKTTDSDGNLSFEDLIIGDYTAYEVGNSHFGYVARSSGVNILINPGSNNQTIKNDQIYTKISGYVWKDYIEGKTSNPNYEYDTGEARADEKEVIVRLKNSNGTLATLYNGTTGSPSFGSSLGTGGSSKHVNNNGEYLFEGVKITDLNNLYIEFEYDGLIYQTVPVKNNQPNGSKVDETDRNNFNISFKNVKNNGKDSSTTDGNRDIKYNSYNNTKFLSTLIDDRSVENGKYNIKSNTNNGNYYLIKNFYYGLEEIQNVNMGLYEREQPDMEVQKDVENVQLVMNGYTHTYNYASRLNNQTGSNGYNYSSDKIGLKFENERGKSQYTRPIYKSDIAYSDEEGGTELQVYITYKIQTKNTSTVSSLKVSYVDYYDSDCKVVEAGKGIEESTGNVSETVLTVKDENYNSNFNKTTITENGENIDTLIAPQTTKDVYIKFKLNRTAIKKILNGDKIIDNVVDINSYTIYNSDGSIRAGIDVDSAPGNAIPGTVNTYEDDTDTAPSLVLQKAEDRDFQGTVFEDNAVEPTGTGNIREGNGKYDSNENTIGGVDITIKQDAMTYKTTTVTDKDTYGIKMYVGNSTTPYKYIDNAGNPNLIPKNSTITFKPEKYDSAQIDNYINIQHYNEDKSTYVDKKVVLEKGSFYINAYIPGEYTTTYTWGDNECIDLSGNKKTITVQDYKGTIFNKEAHLQVAEKTETEKNKWYLNNPTTRYQDAKDNYANEDKISRDKPNGSRQQIDQEMSDIYNGEAETGYTYHKMDSTTPIMDIGIEDSDKDSKKANFLTDGNSSYNYNISNIDFGIIERAKQELTVNKRISHVKLTLANQQVILDSDVKINTFGNYEIKTPNNICTYIPVSTSNPYGEVKIELDNELIQGSRLEITYSLTVENVSEVDYDDINYYHYGEIPSESDKDKKVVKITPTKVFDYLDKENSLNPDKSGEWKEYTNIGSAVDTTYQYEPTLKERQNVTITTDASGTNVTKADGSTLQYGNWKTELYGQRYKDLLTQRVYYNNGKVLANNHENLTIDSAIDAENSDFSGFLAPKASKEVSFDASKILTSTDDISLDNKFEVTKIDKKSTGSTGENKGHTLIISSSQTLDIVDNSETAIVVPSTGANYDYTEEIILSFSTLAILGAGILIIKKRTLK